MSHSEAGFTYALCNLNPEPILSPNARSKAWRCVESIATDTLQIANSASDPTQLCQAALLFAYISKVEQSQYWKQNSVRILNRALEVTSQSHINHIGLYEGLTGVGWITQHISRLYGLANPTAESDAENDEEDPITAIDNFTMHRLRWPSRLRSYDLISGLVGIGVYWLERMPRKSARSGIQTIIKELLRRAEISQFETTWFTSANDLPESQAQICPLGHYNLGVAHGILGITYLLVEAIHADIETSAASTLLDGCMNWLRAHQRPADALSRYGNWLAPGEPQSESRLAWCYGDLGISGVLHHVAARSGVSAWRDLAEGLASACASRSPDDSGVRDAQLCHGAIGIAHVFSRIFKLSTERRYYEEARKWFERGMDMQRSGQGIGGFLAWDHVTMRCSKPNVLFLDGAIGIALALISASTSVEPEWDRLMLLSGR